MNRIVFCTYYRTYIFSIGTEGRATFLNGDRVGEHAGTKFTASCDHPINKRLVDAIDRRQREQWIEESSFTPMDDRDLRSAFRPMVTFTRREAATVRSRGYWYIDWGI